LNSCCVHYLTLHYIAVSVMPEFDVKKDVGVKKQEVVDWNAVIPKAVDYEDSLNPVKVRERWEAMYKLAGMATVGEDEKRMLRAAVYVHGALNGASRVGDFEGMLTLANGKVVPSSVIVNAVGKQSLRRFFRSNMNESYECLKNSAVMERYSKFIKKGSVLGISAENCFAMADWLTNCPLFTPMEEKAHTLSLEYGITRAYKARGGKTLEEIEKQRVQGALDVQGPAESGGKEVTW